MCLSVALYAWRKQSWGECVGRAWSACVLPQGLSVSRCASSGSILVSTNVDLHMFVDLYLCADLMCVFLCVSIFVPVCF